MSGAYDEDGVDLLTSDFGPERAAFARRLTTALRLLASDASGLSIPSAGVHPTRAYEVLEERRARRAFDALVAVYEHGLGHALRASFVQVERPVRDYTAAWLDLARELPPARRRALGLELPSPGLDAPALLALLDGPLAELAAPLGPLAQVRAERLQLLRRAAVGSDRGLRSAVEGLVKRVHALPMAGGRALRRALLIDRIALGLDARRLAELGPLLERVTELPARMADCGSAQDALALFARWAARRDVPFPRWSGSRAEALGVTAPTWSELERVLAGGAPDPHTAGPPGPGAAGTGLAPPVHGAGGRAGTGGPGCGPALDRHTCGARAVCVLAFGPRSGLARIVGADCAPGLRASLAGWVRGRRDALRERGAPEHEVVRRCEALAWCGGSESAARVLSSATIGAAEGDPTPPAALFVEPIIDAEGEVRGLLWVELEHPLLPSLCARTELMRVAERLLDGRGARSTPGVVIRTTAAGPSAMDGADAGLVARWSAAVDALQLKLAERRWVAFEPAGSSEGDADAASPGFVAVAEGGEGDLGPPAGDVERWLARAVRTAGTVRYGDGVGTGRFARSLHGVAIPLRFGGGVVAVLALETARRGDLRARDVERWETALDASVGALLAARLDARDRRLGFAGVALDPTDPASAFDVHRLAALGRSAAPLCILGPASSGRTSLARALVHVGSLSGRGAARLRVVDGLGGPTDDWPGAGSPDALVVRDVDRIEAGAARTLARTLLDAHGRVLLTARGEHAPPVARGLGAATVRLRALSARRTEVVPIARAMLSARGEASSLREDGAAALFRQGWEGGCGELATVLATARVEVPGGPLDRDAVERALVANGLEPVRRLPSREPDATTVAAAAWCTRTSTGRINKARASGYLGWDPATLSARLRDLGLSDLGAVAQTLRAASNDRSLGPGGSGPIE